MLGGRENGETPGGLRCSRPPSPAACPSRPGSPSRTCCGRRGGSPARSSRAAKRDATLLAHQAAGGCRHRHRQRRRAVAPAFRARLSRRTSTASTSPAVEMGIRNDRYKAMVPTVTGPLRRKGRVHAVEARLARAHTQAEAEVHAARADDDRRHDRRRALRRPRDAGDGVRRSCSTRRRASSRPIGVDVIQFDEPAFNVYMDAVTDWGIAALDRAAEGLACTTAVHICYGYGIKANIDWKATLGARVAAVRGDLPGAGGEPHRPGLARMPQLARCRSSCSALLAGKDVLVGAIDVATDTSRRPEEVAATIGEAIALRAAGAALPVHQLRHGADAPRRRAGRSSRRSAPARRWRGSGSDEQAVLTSPIAARDLRQPGPRSGIAGPRP